MGRRGSGADGEEWVLSDAATRDDAALVHKAALTVLRPDLKRVEMDPAEAGWPEEVRSAVDELHAVGAAQGRWPERKRVVARTGVDLDPAVDRDFEIACALAPHAVLADGWDLAGNNVYEATDSGGLLLTLSRAQHEELTQRLLASVVDPTLLTRRR
jgi:hypothetical protein